MQEKTPVGRTTCPSCSNRCADGGRTGLRVRLVFVLRGGGCRPRPRSGSVGSWTGEAGGRRRNRPYLSFPPPQDRSLGVAVRLRDGGQVGLRLDANAAPEVDEARRRGGLHGTPGHQHRLREVEVGHAHSIRRGARSGSYVTPARRRRDMPLSGARAPARRSDAAQLRRDQFRPMKVTEHVPGPKGLGTVGSYQAYSPCPDRELENSAANAAFMFSMLAF